MGQAITGIDHPVVLVRDLDAARSAYQRLGFLAAPRGIQAEHVGTHNHAIVLEGGYVDLLGVRVPTELNERLRRTLEQREGIHFIALRTGDAGAAARELRARGIAAGDPVTFSRPIDAPGGPAEAAFALTFIPEEATPGGAVMFACQQLTPEHLWLPPLKRHPNTAERLDSITAVVDDAAAVAEPYAALFGPDGVTVAAPDDPASAPVPAMVTVATGGIPLRFLTPGALARRYPGVDLGGVRPPAVVGLGVKVRDPTAARVCLDDAGIVPIEVPGGCCVAPAEACGVLIEFRA